MSALIAEIVKLSKLRVKEDLDVALTAIIYDALPAKELHLLSIDGRAEEISVRRYIDLPVPTSGASSGFRTLEPAEPLTGPMLADALQCYKRRTHLQRLASGDRASSHLFPVLGGRTVVSVLEVITPSPLVTEEIDLVVALLDIYCNLVAMLDSSGRDELTGLFNRRTFGDSFKRIVKPMNAMSGSGDLPEPDRRRPELKPKALHLAVMDIDFFKRINDQFGHPYGDEVLVLLARLMGECFRESDVTFRFGGEEFLVILSNTDLQDAEIVLERFRAKVESFSFSQVGRVTVSIGFTKLLPGDSGSAAFGRADQALYVAKHSGRNQVQSYELLIANGTLVSAAGHEQDVEMF